MKMDCKRSSWWAFLLPTNIHFIYYIFMTGSAHGSSPVVIAAPCLILAMCCCILLIGWIAYRSAQSAVVQLVRIELNPVLFHQQNLIWMRSRFVLHLGCPFTFECCQAALRETNQPGYAPGVKSSPMKPVYTFPCEPYSLYSGQLQKSLIFPDGVILSSRVLPQIIHIICESFLPIARSYAY